MTFLTTFAIAPASRGSFLAPCELILSDLTIVVPVKNNQPGVTRLLQACLTLFPSPHAPAEILFVDNGSHPPLEVPTSLAAHVPVRVLLCPHAGAAAARNLGARQAHTSWILFLDSDCLPTPGLLDGYRHALNGSVAYVGTVQAEHHDPLSRYYDTQRILAPLPLWDNDEQRPAYLITANALVWRQALAQVGGFDERFPSAAAEDIDLGLRLWSVGPLAYAPAACVLHTFEPHLSAFVRRFARYGRGNRLLAARYQADLTPHPFVPQQISLLNTFLAGLQWLALSWGYHTSKPAATWSYPISLPAWSPLPPEMHSPPGHPPA